MRELKAHTGRTVVVNLADSALRGTVESATAEAVVLLDVTVVSAREPVPVDGLVIVPAGRIEFVQVV